MNIIRTFPTIQILLDDGVTLELSSDVDGVDPYITFWAAGDTPGMAEPLNELELSPLYTPAE